MFSVGRQSGLQPRQPSAPPPTPPPPTGRCSPHTRRGPAQSVRPDMSSLGLTSSSHQAAPGNIILFREEKFELKVPDLENSARGERLFSFLASSEEEPDLDQASSDPALYWANSQRHRQRNKPLRGSYSKKGTEYNSASTVLTLILYFILSRQEKQ